METKNFSKLGKAMNFYFSSFSQLINRFKKDYTKENILKSVKNWNSECDKNGKLDEKVNITEKELIEIGKLIARKDFYVLVKFGFANVDGIICELLETERVSNYNKTEKKVVSKLVGVPMLAGVSYKPFGFRTDKKTGCFLRDTFAEKQIVKKVNQTDDWTILKYCFEKTQFTYNDVLKVLRDYIAKGCPEIDGVKYSDIQIERKNGKKNEPKKDEPKKATTRKRTNKDEPKKDEPKNAKRDKYKKLILLATNEYKKSKDNRTKKILEYLRARYKREIAA